MPATNRTRNRVMDLILGRASAEARTAQGARPPPNSTPDSGYNSSGGRRRERETQEREETRDLHGQYQDELLERVARLEEQQRSREDAKDQEQLKDYDDKAKEALGNYRSGIFYLFALIVAGISDLLDLAISGMTWLGLLVPGAGWAVSAVGWVSSLILNLITILLLWLLLGTRCLGGILGYGGLETLLGFVGLDAIPTYFIGVFVQWRQASQAHQKAGEWKKKKRELQTNLNKAKKTERNEKYREPSVFLAFVLILLPLFLLLLLYWGIAPIGSFPFNLLAFVTILLWISAHILHFPSDPAWNHEFLVSLLQIATVIAIIGAFIFYFAPLLIGGIRSGDLQNSLEQGALQAQIQGKKIAPYLDFSRWWEKQLQLTGLQPEGKAETQKVGVRVAKMDTGLPSGGYYREGDPVTIYIKLLSTLYYPTTLYNHCVLSQLKQPIGAAAEIDPETINLYETKEQTVTCTWRDLKSGSYKATYTGTIQGKTNAHVTLTFVSRSTLESFRSHEPDVDINRFLSIDPVFKPLYTQGPITVQFDRITQPISLIPNEEKTVHLNLILDTGPGTVPKKSDPPKKDSETETIPSGWSDGRIQHLSQLILYLPQEIQLIPSTGCEGYEKTESTIQGYDQYTFPYDKLGTSRTSFRRVNCPLTIPKPEDLLHGQPKALRTVAAEIDYKYKIEKEITFRVKP